MSKLISPYDRQRYPTYADAEEYFAATGLRAPWNPDKPERHWCIKPGDVGPFLLLPDIGGAQGNAAIAAVELKAPTLDLLLPNIPSKPTIVPWSKPASGVTQNGQPSDKYFPTKAEVSEAMDAVNAQAKVLNRPTLSNLRESQMEGFPYSYPADDHLPEMQRRRNWVFDDTTGQIYDAGLWLERKLHNGAAVVEAVYKGGKLQNIERAPGWWSYGVSGGWQWVADPRLTARDPAPSKLPPIGVCVALEPGEELFVSAQGLGFQTLFVKTGTGPIEVARPVAEVLPVDLGPILEELQHLREQVGRVEVAVNSLLNGA